MAHSLRFLRCSPALLTVLMLAGCSSNDDPPPPQPVPPPTPQPSPERGALMDDAPPVVVTYTPDQMLDLMGQTDVGRSLVELAYRPQCTVNVHQLRYYTEAPDASIQPASGALMVPSGDDPVCNGERPVVLYAHGTSTKRDYNIAMLTNADGDENAEAILIAAAFAAHGYVVVAPNYLGYDSSTLDYHPYLNADQQSKDMIDALTGARSALPLSTAANTTAAPGVLITGYSQGGHVAMATHRAMEALGETVTASAPMSGPYAMSAFADAIFSGQVSAGSVDNLTLVMNSYQRAYGDLYAQVSEAINAPYAAQIESLLPSTRSMGDIRSDGLLPDDQIFDSTPPAPEYADITPATDPGSTLFTQLYARGFGSEPLITNSYRLAYLQDRDIAPDGGFPQVTDGLPPANPAHPLRVALKLNDLRNWVPNAPVLLCAGHADPTVYYRNTELMEAYWTANPPANGFTVLNIDSSGSGDDPYSRERQVFQAVKDLVRAEAVIGGADDNGDEALAEVYHAALVSAFCLSSAKRFFDQQQ